MNDAAACLTTLVQYTLRLGPPSPDKIIAAVERGHEPFS